MARSVDEINKDLVEALVAQFAAAGITIDPKLWSARDILRLICYTIALGIAVFEQLQDAYYSKLEDIQSKAPAASSGWIQDAMFKFQFSSTDPQVLQLINVTPSYPVVDEQLRIIKACSVRSTLSNQVLVKVAKGSPLESLTDTEIAAAQDYINIKGIAGINYLVASGASDKVFIEANIYFKGSYAAVIKTKVIEALDNYFETLSQRYFDTVIKLTDLENVIRTVDGVNDVMLLNVKYRADISSFSDGLDLVLNQTVIRRQVITFAGYATQETINGKTFNDTLNFIAE